MADTATELIEAGVDITTTLTVHERARLQECEEIIEKNIRGFLATGYALAEIRDRRLYREDFKTFEKYCKQIWDFSRSSAYHQISGYEAVQNLIDQKMCTIVHKNDESEMSTMVDKNDESGEMPPMGDKTKTEPTTALDGLVEIVGNGLGERVDMEEGSNMTSDGRPRFILPQNEAQTRPLTKLSPDDQVKAWDIVLDQLNRGKKLTSYLIGQAVKEVKGEVVKKKVKKKKEEVENTRLVSKIFATQYQVLLDIISAEKKLGWKQSSKKEVVKHLNEMIKIVEMEE